MTMNTPQTKSRATADLFRPRRQQQQQQKQQQHHFTKADAATKQTQQTRRPVGRFSIFQGRSKNKIHQGEKEISSPASPTTPQPQRQRQVAQHMNVTIRQQGKIHQVRALVNLTNPTHAYVTIQNKKSIKTNMGYVLFCHRIPQARYIQQQQEQQAMFEAPSNMDMVETVAVKICHLDKIREFKTKGNAEDPLKELDIMEYAGDNKHVMGCLEILCDQKNLYMIMPNCEYGELLSLVYERNDSSALPQMGPLPEPVARYIFREMLINLRYLKNRGIVHRDISSENIMFDESGNCLFIDMGMAVRVPAGMEGHRRAIMEPTLRCGKYPYMSPETFASDRLIDGYSVDLWSCAVVLFSMLTGPNSAGIRDGWRILYREPSERDTVFGVLTHPNNRGLEALLKSWNLTMSKNAINLLQSIFQSHPLDRPTLEDVLSHPWVANPDVITRTEFLQFLKRNT